MKNQLKYALNPFLNGLSSKNGLHLASLGSARLFSTSIAVRSTNCFKLFPQTFPNGGPPKDSFIVKPKLLRREYRLLQSEHHPDVTIDEPTDISSLVNKAYSTIKNPYTRIAAVVELHHPEHLDITKDEVAKLLISTIQNQSPEASLAYKNMLMLVLDAHESLELAELESDLEDLNTENDERLDESEVSIEDLLTEGTEINWDHVVMEAIKLKYWVNIQNGIKDWEQGKPIHLTH